MLWIIDFMWIILCIGDYFLLDTRLILFIFFRRLRIFIKPARITARKYYLYSDGVIRIINFLDSRSQYNCYSVYLQIILNFTISTYQCQIWVLLLSPSYCSWLLWALPSATGNYISANICTDLCLNK